jgi:hypothetical protein
MYGSVLFACLGNDLSTLTANCMVFKEAEIFVRKMLRWAMRTDVDTRCSFLYVVSNCVNVGVLSHKSCFRFFDSLEKYPRTATKFVKNIRSLIDPSLLGQTTITWWPEVASLYGQLQNTKPIYNRFRKTVIKDLKESVRLEQNGMRDIFCDMVRYCFAGEEFSPPLPVRTILMDLLSPQHALCIAD